MIIHLLQCKDCQGRWGKRAVVAILILVFLLTIFLVVTSRRARAAEKMTAPVTGGMMDLSKWNKLSKGEMLEFWALMGIHYKLLVNPACPVPGVKIFQNDEDGAFYYLIFCPSQVDAKRLPHPREIIPTTILRVPAAKM